MRALATLLVEAVVGIFNRRQGLLFFRPVLGADGLGALESHVLEHVSQSGLAFRVVHRPGIHVGVEGNHRRLVPLENDEVQTVSERELGNSLFELFKILRRDAQRQQEKYGEELGGTHFSIVMCSALILP